MIERQIDNTCFFSGHRDIENGRYDEIFNDVKHNILNLYRDGIRWFISGGALGFDLLAAKAVIEIRDFDRLDIRLHLILPCLDQAVRFSLEDKLLYHEVKSFSDSHEILYPHYVRGCMHARNRKMVDSARVGMVYCHKETGGTAFTVNYAKKRGTPLIFLK